MELNKRYIGFVFQSYHLIDNLTVYENLDLPLSYRNLKSAERAAIVADTLDRFQIVGKKDLFPQQLSGGQQQLVAVARAVIAKPKLILADEPTGNLHSSQGKEIMELFKKLNQEGTTIIQVTHSDANAAYGNRTVIPARRLDRGSVKDMSMDVPREGAARKRLIRRTGRRRRGAHGHSPDHRGLVAAQARRAGRGTRHRVARHRQAGPHGPRGARARLAGSRADPLDPGRPPTAVSRELLVLAGAVVKANTVLVVLTNPELELAALDAEYEVKAAEARYKDLQVQLESQRLIQEADLVKIQSDYRQAKLRADRDNKLAEAGLMIELDRQISAGRRRTVGQPPAG